MKRLILSIAAIAALCTACAPKYGDTTLYQRTGRQKAIVAILPVLNTGNATDLTWNVSQELTDEIRARIYDSTRVYLLRDHGSQEIARQLNVPNPEQIPLEETKNLGAAEFVVVSELVDQSTTPSVAGADLNLAMRIRVIDIRHDQPKVLLQEVICHTHEIARPYLHSDYNRTPWGTEAFERTPLGMAHNQMVKEIVGRIENYVDAAR